MGSTKPQPFVVREYNLDMGTVKVYKDFMVGIFEEGSTLTMETIYQIIGISEIHFRNRRFGYISLRQNSYAIDPTVYTYMRGLKNLKAFAVVSKKKIDMHNFKIEKLFYKNNMEFFIEYENAVSWVCKKIKKGKKSKQSKV